MKMLSLLFSVFNLMAIYANSSALQWETLEEGGKIHIVAPSYGSNDTKAHLTTATIVIEKKGFGVEFPDDLIIPQSLGYSNTLIYRQEHLKQVLFAEDVKVVWAIRGGRGASEVMEPLENLKAPEKIKLIVGFSDTTALHLLAAAWGWPSLHCSVLAYHQEGSHAVNKKTSLQPIFDILSGKTQEVSYNLVPLNSISKEYQGTINSQIRGGNASVIQRSIGTPLHLTGAGKILFFEDTGEPATKFLEIMTHFHRARLLEDIKAIILGDFESGLTEPQRADLSQAKEIFLQKMTELKIPVLGSSEFGHGDINHPLPFGTEAQLDFQGADRVSLRISTTGFPLQLK